MQSGNAVVILLSFYVICAYCCYAVLSVEVKTSLLLELYSDGHFVDCTVVQGLTLD